MRAFPVLFLLILFSPAYGAGADLAAGRAQYDAALAKFHAALEEAKKDLGTKYIAALQSLRAKAQSGGNLDHVMQVMEEIERFEKIPQPPPAPLPVPDLQKLAEALAKRTAELEAKTAAEVRSLTAKYDAVLAARQVALTREGKLQEAMEVQAERKSLASPGSAHSAGPASPPPAAAGMSIFEMLTSPDFAWSAPENLGPSVNSPRGEYRVSVSADGLTLVFDSSRNGNSDVFESRRSNTKAEFGKAREVEAIRTSGPENDPFISADGLVLLYAAEQGEGHQGSFDLYQTRRKHRDAPWEPPVNLGPVVNRGSADVGPSLSHDGLRLLFSSTRSGGQGDFDFWISRRASVDAPWEKPENMGPGVNTAERDFFPRLAADDQTLLFSGADERCEIFVAAPGPGGGYVTRALNLPVAGKCHSPSLSRDGRTLYFCSDHPGGQGGWDVWRMHRGLKNR